MIKFIKQYFIGSIATEFDPSFRGVPNIPPSVENREVENASKKRCDTITTVVLLVLLVVSICLSGYFTVHPLGPTIPNTTLSIPLLVSLAGTLGFGMGFLVLFLRCVKSNSYLENSYLENKITDLKRRIALLEQKG